MKNINLIAVIFFVFYITSCVFDPPPPAIRINNASNETIKINVNYNNFILNDFDNNNVMASLISYTGDYYGDCIKVIDFDTINLIGKYLLEPNCIFSLRFYRLSEQSFKFNTMKVIKGNDTLNVSASIDSLYLFKKLKWQQYELKIK